MPTQSQYLLFTSLVKHGELLRYLLAAQVRKRLMEPYGFHRQVKSSALTGNPDRIFEIYYVEEPGQTLEYLEALSRDPAFKASHQLIRHARCRPPTTKDGRPSHPKHTSSQELPPPLQKLLQMDYLLQTKSQQECAQSLAQAPYLLQTTCTLHSNDMLPQFNSSMKALLGTFADSGLTLLVAGQHAGRIELSSKTGRPLPQTGLASEESVRVLNVWQFEDPDSIQLLMSRLADNPTYSALDTLCTQEQHICRNVSRHYQHYPLLSGIPLAI